MKVTITGKNIEVSEYLRDLALKKIAKLERYFPEDTEVLITMAVEKTVTLLRLPFPIRAASFAAKNPPAICMHLSTTLLQSLKSRFTATKRGLRNLSAMTTLPRIR